MFSIQGITGNKRSIEDFSTEKLYRELGLESLRRWFQKFCIFNKIVKEQSPEYLFESFLSNNISY